MGMREKHGNLDEKHVNCWVYNVIQTRLSQWVKLKWHKVGKSGGQKPTANENILQNFI